MNKIKYDFADWTTDDCSNVPNYGPGFDFTQSCAQHDFGYRNWKRLGTFRKNLWGEGRRKTIDDHFDGNMDLYCNKHSAWWYIECESVRNDYYFGV